MEAVITRLEAVASRLEAAESKVTTPSAVSKSATFTPPRFSVALPGLATPGKQPIPAAPVVAAVPSGTNLLAEWDAEVVPALHTFMSAAETIGGEVFTASQTVQKAFEGERTVIDAISQCQGPTQAGLQILVSPVGTQMQAASSLAEGRSSTAFNHKKVVAEALQSLSWVVYTGPNCEMSLPTQHIEEAWQSAEFYANKVLMEFRNTEPAHVNWIKNLKDVLLKMKDHVQKHHRAGPAWNPQGIPVTAFLPSSKSAATSAGPAPAKAAPKPPGGGPPPPPPPPAGSLFKEKATGTGAKKAGSTGVGMGAVFSEINKQGSGVTGGLRKVTDDMKTKNQADRTGVVSTSSPASATPASSISKGKTIGPPRIECEQGRKWIVENQDGNKNIVVDDTSPKQTVYIYRCKNSTVQVKGKLNAITIDECTGTGLVFQDLVASCELVNSSGLQVQVTGLVPTVAVDKCDGIQLYLSEASMTSSITTAKSSAVNVLVPGKEGEDMTELYVPEQFVSTFKDGRFVTEPVSHSG